MPCKRKGSNWRSTAASSCRARVMLTTTDTTKSLSSKIVMFKLSAASALHNLKPAFKLPGPVRPGLTAPLAIEASPAARAGPATKATWRPARAASGLCQSASAGPAPWQLKTAASHSRTRLCPPVRLRLAAHCSAQAVTRSQTVKVNQTRTR